MMEQIQMKSEGRRVTFKSLLIPQYPATVIVPSATTRARVPASVDSNPPLYVPFDSRDDITRDSSDRLTPTPDSEKKKKKRIENKYISWCFVFCKARITNLVHTSRILIRRFGVLTFKNFSSYECN